MSLPLSYFGVLEALRKLDYDRFDGDVEWLVELDSDGLPIVDDEGFMIDAGLTLIEAAPTHWQAMIQQLI